MVYDERGNFIGDTHWREDYEFGDGEEVQLERGGVIVQASEHVASHSQDLSELIDKRIQEKEQRQSAAAASARQPRSAPSGGMPVRPQSTASHFQLRHAPLHNLLGTPTGHHGRALAPTESPYEERRRSNALQSPEQQRESPRPTKRRRREPSPPSKSGYAQSLFGATLTLSGGPMSSAPVRQRPSSQSCRRDQNPPTSSNVSTEHGEEAGVRIVSPPAKNGTQRSVPLTERRPAAINQPRTRPEGLIGKDARSKVNVPSLLQARPQGDKTPVGLHEATRPMISESSKVNRSLEPVDDLGPMPTEVTKKTNLVPKTRAAPAARRMNSLCGQEDDIDLVLLDEPTRAERVENEMIASDASPNGHLESRYQPAGKDHKERSRVRATKGSRTVNKPSTTASLHRAIPFNDSSARQTPTAPVILRNEPVADEEPLAQKAVVRGPRIELRMAPSKKRGLLVLSEKDPAEKVKRARKPDTQDVAGQRSCSSTSDNRTDTSQGTKTRFSRDVVSGVGVIGQVSGHASKQLEVDAMSTEPGAIEQVSIAADTRDGTAALNSFQLPAQNVPTYRDPAHGQGIRLNASNVQTAKENAAANKPALPWPQEQEELFDSAYEPPKGKELKQQRRQGSARQVESRAQSRREPHQEVATNSSDMPRHEEDPILGIEAEAHESPSASPMRSNNYQRDFDEILSRRPENAPPPRLAQLSRKSVRSREVIGLFYEDGTASFQPKPVARPGAATVTLPKLLPANRLFGIDDSLDGSARADDEAAKESSAHLAEQNIGCNEKRPEMAVQQVKSPRKAMGVSRPLHGEAFDLERQDQSALIVFKAQAGPESKLLNIPRVPPNRATQLASASVIQGQEKDEVVPAKQDVVSDTTTLTEIDKDKDDSSQINGKLNNESACVVAKAGYQPAKLPKSASGLSFLSHVPDAVDGQGEAVSTTVSSRKPVPRIVNPATRGKKAAKPSDAAGQVPERSLPSDGQVIGRPVSNTAKISLVELPSFSKANGGPWSREAYDLFEYQRPD